MGKEVEVVEMCPECGTEVRMFWDIEAFGYEAFCPVCGHHLMLCDECCHEITEDNPEGDCCVSCDYTEDGGCKKRREHPFSAKRKIELFGKMIEYIAGEETNSDVENTLRFIGFTDEEISELVEVEKDLADMNYSEACLWFNEADENEVLSIVDCEDFFIFRHNESGRYFYIEQCAEGSADEFFEVKLVSTVSFDASEKLYIEKSEQLMGVLGCDMCGVCLIGDEAPDHLEICYFKKKESK